MLEPWPALDGHGLIAHIPSNPPFTSPTKSFSTIGICGPRHILTAGFTLHLTPKQATFLHELNGHRLATEYLVEKLPLRRTVITNHPTSVRKPGDVRHPPQAFYIHRSDLQNVRCHYIAPATRTLHWMVCKRYCLNGFPDVSCIVGIEGIMGVS